MLRFTLLVLFVFALTLQTNSLSFAQQSNAILKNGMVLGPGQISQIQALNKDQGVNSKKDVTVGIITDVNDGLRHTYVNSNNILQATDAGPLFKIEFDGNKSRVQDSSNRAEVIRAAVSYSQFDQYGRRNYIIGVKDKSVAIVQGITEISPQYVRVESLRMDVKKYELEWDMRLALSSLDSETLGRILIQNANPTRAGDWLNIVNLFSDAKRYLEARDMLVRAIHKFPELENNRSQLKQFDQLFADQLFTAAQSAKNVGQHRFATYILEGINKKGLSDETQLKVERRLEQIATEAKEREQLLAWIKEDIAKLSPDLDAKKEMESLIEEIGQHLSPDTSERFTDYVRRRTDATLRPEQIASLAISGWIYGSTIGEDNSSVVGSGVKARRLITEYLSSPAKNDQLVEQISRLESGSPRLVASLLANMPPPLAVPAGSEVSSNYYIRDSGVASQPVQVPGRFLIEVPLNDKMAGRTTQYMVQLPPEYNPFRRYPCVLTLPSEMSSMEEQILWWSGLYAPKSPEQRCLGEASNRGYIVVSPAWAEPKQTTYNYTENEQAMVLAPLRDAMRRFSIDTDRVFISGHFNGGDAAWDIAWSHPDLWAGCIVIGGGAGKYVNQYWENAKFVHSYFVMGEHDGRWAPNTKVWDNLLSRKQFDCIVTNYRGRGLDPFQEEVPRIMEWMSLPSHVRNFDVEEFKTETSRAGDRFYWWFETDQLLTDKLAHPLLYAPSPGYPIESSIKNNSVQFKNVPAKSYSVWLTPDMVDFTKIITVEKKRIEPKPSLRVMLEDVRGRADRQHPFWMKIEMPK